MKTLKTMFTIILSLALCVMMFSACQPSKPDPQSGSDTTTTTTTTETVTTTTEATTTTTAPVIEVALNTELLSCIGKTYSEISALYGDPVQITMVEGGFPAYRLENSNGFYDFAGLLDWEYNDTPGLGNSLVPKNENGEWIVETAPLPLSDAPCGGIWYIPVKDIFLGLTESIAADELAAMYNIEHRGSGYSYIAETHNCVFQLEDLEFYIDTEEDYLIGLDTIIGLVKTTARL